MTAFQAATGREWLGERAELPRASVIARTTTVLRNRTSQAPLVGGPRHRGAPKSTRPNRRNVRTAGETRSCEAQLQKSVAFEDFGARIDSPSVRNDPLAVLGLQERSSDPTRPDDEVPQATKLLNDDVHLSLPRRTSIPANSRLSRSLHGTVILIPIRNTARILRRTTISIVSRAFVKRGTYASFGVAASIRISRRRSIART